MWTPHILCQPIWGVFTFRQDCSKTSCIEKLIEPEFTTKLNEWRSCILHRMYCFCSVWLGIDIGISICIGIGVGIVHLDIAIGICIVSVVYALALAILSFWLGCRETKPPYYQFGKSNSSRENPVNNIITTIKSTGEYFSQKIDQALVHQLYKHKNVKN